MGVGEIIREREGTARSEEYQIISERGRVRMISFWKRDGSVHCANYAFLHGIAAGQREIRLDFSRYVVVIKGSCLGMICRGLADHRISYLRESENTKPILKGHVWIEQILILFDGEGGASSARKATPAAWTPVRNFRPGVGEISPRDYEKKLWRLKPGRKRQTVVQGGMPVVNMRHSVKRAWFLRADSIPESFSGGYQHSCGRA